MNQKPTGIEALSRNQIPAYVLRDFQYACCQGACKRTGECGPSVRIVRVSGWGWFTYCDTAIARDIASGFVLYDEHDEAIEPPAEERGTP